LGLALCLSTIGQNSKNYAEKLKRRKPLSTGGIALENDYNALIILLFVGHGSE
jgi:hypothetical protein